MMGRKTCRILCLNKPRRNRNKQILSSTTLNDVLLRVALFFSVNLLRNGLLCVTVHRVHASCKHLLSRLIKAEVGLTNEPSSPAKSENKFLNHEKIVLH